MKKNMLYLATGAVFFIFAVCIAYIFTEPGPQKLQQSDALQEHNASQLIAEKNKPTPSADSLIFTAQNNVDEISGNAGQVTEPPKKNEEKQAVTNTDTPLTAKTEKPADAPTETQQEKTGISKTEQPADPIPTQQETKQTNQTSQVPQPAKQDKLPVPFDNDPLKTKVILESHKNTNTIVYAELLMDGNQVSLVFEGNKPIKPKTFRLNNPERVVLDIEGYWILKLPKLISNRMVKEIRSNAQKDKTRIVFEAKVPLKSTQLYRIHSRKYQLVFK